MKHFLYFQRSNLADLLINIAIHNLIGKYHKQILKLWISQIQNICFSTVANLQFSPQLQHFHFSELICKMQQFIQSLLSRFPKYLQNMDKLFLANNNQIQEDISYTKIRNIRMVMSTASHPPLPTYTTYISVDIMLLTKTLLA